jgi:hypothetical protein
VAGLVLGPLLRYAGTEDATIWVETDAPCRVEVTIEGADACARRTFAVEGHHYALLHCTGLQSDSTAPYEVRLDGETVWPEADSPFPPSVVRTHSGEEGAETRILFGSCRVAAPHEPPHSLRKDEHPEGREVDSLIAVAQRMAHEDPEQWPHALLMLGDQVYADEVSPAVKEFIRERRDPEVPPYETVADFRSEECKQMAPILKDVKMELKENIRILKVNVDKNPVIATKYQIRNVPTVIIFKNGQPQWKGVGVKPAFELTSILRQHIKP